MDQSMERKILVLLGEHRIMTIATVRPDGWPQATTVGYTSEGLKLWSITGLSMAAHAHRVTNPAEARRALQRLAQRYPDAPGTVAALPMPSPDEVAVFRVVPELISVLDYRQGFAHTDLVAC